MQKDIISSQDQKEQQSNQLLNNQTKNPNDTLKKMQLIQQMIHQTQDGKDQRKFKYYQDLLKKHHYWDSRPMLRDDKQQIQYGNIEGLRKVEDVTKEPVKLPDKFLFWTDVDIKNDLQLNQLYHLLSNHYVEDQHSMLRFEYSKQFLRWVLCPPAYQPKWLVGIRNQQKQLIAFIAGIPVHTCVEKDKIKMANIDYLCVHKQYRMKKLTAILFTQITRRVNIKDRWQAIFGSSRNIPTPITRTTYYQRTLNPKKLSQVNMSGLNPSQNLSMLKKLYSLPQETSLNFRSMTKKDVFGVYELVNQGLSKFLVRFQFTEEEIKHYFLPQDKVIYTYVIQKVENVQGNKKTKISDVVSFYSLPYNIISGPKDGMIYACYSFYNFATSVSYEQLIRNALILAKKNGFDVYNSLNLMDNATVFDSLRFQTAEGNLNYYIYNWVMKCRKVQPNQLGVVLF